MGYNEVGGDRYEKDPGVRCDAARALGEICDIMAEERRWNWYEAGPPPCVEPLMALCFDENLEVSTAAMWALGCMGDHRAFGPLVAIWENHNESKEKRQVANEAMTTNAFSVFTDLMAIWKTQGAPWEER